MDGDMPIRSEVLPAEGRVIPAKKRNGPAPHPAVNATVSDLIHAQRR